MSALGVYAQNYISVALVIQFLVIQLSFLHYGHLWAVCVVSTASERHEQGAYTRPSWAGLRNAIFTQR